MKALKSTDNVSIIFGTWFDKTYGNTYYDALVRVNEEIHEVSYQYGYSAGQKQSIDESLAAAGYRVRSNKDTWKPYRAIHTSTTSKLKRDLYK